MMDKSMVKVGDRLRCVEPVGRLICGELYEVTGVGASGVDVVGPGLSETGGYFFSRFEPLTEAAVEAKGLDREVCHRCARRMARPEAALCSICFAQAKSEASAKPAAKVDRRFWDADNYNGLDAQTYAQLSTLDKRIAAARSDLDRPAPVRFPHPGRNFELKGFKS